MREQRSRHDGKGHGDRGDDAPTIVDLDRVIREHVLRGLGSPPRYLRTDVIPLYQDHGLGRYRVNVRAEIGRTPEMAIIASIITDSFFVLADFSGVVGASPGVVRRY